MDEETIDVEEYEDFAVDEEEEQSSRHETLADTSSRSGKSLGTLTRRFIEFLQDSPVGLVDINSVCAHWLFNLVIYLLV